MEANKLSGSNTAAGLWEALWSLTCVPGGCSDGVRGAGAGARGDGAGRVAGLIRQTHTLHQVLLAPPRGRSVHYTVNVNTNILMI